MSKGKVVGEGRVGSLDKHLSSPTWVLHSGIRVLTTGPSGNSQKQTIINMYIEWINNKVLLYSTGNYIQYSVINHNGKENEKECVYI